MLSRVIAKNVGDVFLRHSVLCITVGQTKWPAPVLLHCLMAMTSSDHLATAVAPSYDYDRLTVTSAADRGRQAVVLIISRRHKL